MYGGSLREWLYETPVIWFWVHVRMLGRIQAEGAIDRINAALVSNQRALPEEDHRTFLSELHAQASAGGKPQRAPKATLSELAGMGIQVVRQGPSPS